MANTLTGSALINQIIAQAQADNLDPKAVLSVATVEGGFNGAVGDNGTSFGPFQLHRGGAMPANKPGSWAQTPAGVAYAENSMAKVGAAGQTGQTAIDTIVSKFERPANVPAEEQHAGSVYNSVNASTPNALLTSFQWKDFKQMLIPPILPLGKASVDAGKKAASATESTGHFLGLLTQKNTWIRIAEVIGGGVITLYGLSMLVKSVNSSTGSNIPNPAESVINGVTSKNNTIRLLNSAAGRGYTTENPLEEDEPKESKPKEEANVEPKPEPEPQPKPESQPEKVAETAKASVEKASEKPTEKPKKSSIGPRDKESIRKALYNQTKIEKAEAKKAK